MKRRLIARGVVSHIFKLRFPVYLIIVLVLILGCSNQSESSPKEYLRWVGDIEHDSLSDGSYFTLCNGDENVFQYFNIGEGLQYDGEKKAIKNIFNEKYRPVETIQSGWVRIRFIVNCEGKTSRFRLIGSNLDYQEIDFDKRITTQLLDITKGLQGWKILSLQENPIDYYQYLIFKMDKGKIVEILP